jgi:flagellin-like hook-associated protein FlgL
VSDPLYVPAGENVSFQWRATGDTDTFDIFAYLLNTETGAVTTLLNRTGTSLSDATTWTSASAQVPATGNYRFVFVSGSYDFSGGRATGATMFVDNVQVSGNPPAQKPTSTELDALFGLVESQPASGALQASFELRGQTISSGPSASSAQALRQLKDRIDTLNEQGQLRGVSAQLIGGKLRLTSLYPGEAMGVNQLSVSNNRYLASAQTVQAAQAGVEHATGLAGANVNSTGAQVANGVELSAQAVASAGTLRYQVGANAGETIEFEFQDFTGEQGMLDALTWDVSQRRLARAQLVGSALGQVPVNDEGQVRSHIANREAAAQALGLLDMMLRQVDTRRSLLGAAMNRLLSAGNNVSVGVVQQSGSRSQIEDTDYAKSASALAKQQIVQNAASAVLAQANIRPKEILKLLEG